MLHCTGQETARSQIVEARSSFAEQSTPATYAVVDANASVSGINFVDKDLEYKETIDNTLHISSQTTKTIQSIDPIPI